MKVRSKLTSVLADEALVRINRALPFADDIDGRVTAVGRRWVLVALTRGGGYPDGLAAVRIKDIAAVRRDKSFQAQFAKTRTDWPAVPADLDLDTTNGLIRSLGANFPVVSIEQEGHISDCRWIGAPVLVDEKWTWLHEVTPRAKWRKKPRGYRTKRISYVDVGDSYNTALVECAPPRPELLLTKAPAHE